MNAKREQENFSKIPEDLLLAIENVYDVIDFNCTDPIMETESTDYGACTFSVNGLTIRYRIAKITPTKTGQFVTIWKRNNSGPIEPFDITDDIYLIVIGTRCNACFGQFVFSVTVLYEKGIVSGNNKPGKRGIRVYPPWDIVAGKQAKKTQQWQLPYFLEISKKHLTDLVQAEKLFSLASFK
jgi:hypothetical protein